MMNLCEPRTEVSLFSLQEQNSDEIKCLIKWDALVCLNCFTRNSCCIIDIIEKNGWSINYGILTLFFLTGLLDNVLSDYLWAKAVLLTTTTVATAGLTIQVPIAAVVDTLTGHAPSLMDYVGAAVVMVGFTGINIPSDTFNKPQATQQEQEAENSSIVDHQHSILVIASTPSTS